MVRPAILTAVILLAVSFTGDARSIQVVTKPEIEPIGGFFLYRVVNNKIEYLLLKKTSEDDWSPPKGKLAHVTFHLKVYQSLTYF